MGISFLYWQFYRFLVQNDAPIANLFVTVSQDGKMAYMEKIAIPTFNTPSWDKYLNCRRHGMHIPKQLCNKIMGSICA